MKWTENALGKVTIAVACLAPLPYGSVAYGWVCIWLFILAASVLLQIWVAPLPSRKAPIIVVCLLGLATVGIAAIQVSTWVPSSLVHPAWRTAASNGIGDAAGRIAVDAAEPFFALVPPLATLLAFLAGFLQSNRRWCWSLVKALVFFGSMYALLGILISVSTPGYVLFEKKIAYQNDFTGTFINRNTAACYYGVCLLAAITVAHRGWRQSWPSGYLSWRQTFLFFTRNLSSGAVLWSINAAALLVATLLTGSRAGAASAIVAAVILLFLLINKAGSLRQSLLMGAVIVAVAGLVELFATRNILVRVWEGFGENGRYGAWLSAADIVRDYPLLGTGLGTFKAAFPPYRQDERGIALIWERAHSTPLELAVELGLPAALTVIVLWLATMWLLVRSYRKNDEAYALPALGFCVMLMTGAHSLVDFPMQIPGCAIPVSILVGAVLRQSRDSGSSEPRPASSSLTKF